MSDLRTLPSVDAVLRRLDHLNQFPRELILEEIRRAVSERRQAIASGREVTSESIEEEVGARLEALLKPSLRRVINATGVILHTNLGRAPLGDFQPISGSSNLEYDLETGKRGKRDIHTANLLERLLHRPAILVNNNAAAVFLVLQELASGAEVLISRGELIEIGDGFRIPEIMARSGAVLREVGTTNRTRIDDYRAALNDRTRLIMRVHPSNFHISGFASRPSLKELCMLGKESGFPVYEDLGSGCLVDLRHSGIHEPLVKDSLHGGVNILSFSCDKLLGGPQTGIIAGDADLIARVRRHPLYRALRVDKLIIEALEKTLRCLLLERWAEIPTLQAILSPPAEILRRAERVAARLARFKVEVRESASPVGGGSTPDQTLPTWVVQLTVANPEQFSKDLRLSAIPVVSRIADDKVVFDMRTVTNDEVPILLDQIVDALT